MKVVRNIISLCLVAAFVNVYVSKTVHEVFEHEHTTHACENQDLNHWHEDEAAHLDLICSFTISSSEGKIAPSKQQVGIYVELDEVIPSQSVHFQNVYLNGHLLRGPPVLNS